MITLFRRRIFILASVMTATAAIAGCSPLQNLSSPATPAATHSTASGTPTGTHSPGRDRTPSQSPTSAAADPTTPSQGSTATQTADPTQGATQTADPTQGATQTADPTQGASPTGSATQTASPTTGPTQTGTVCVTSAQKGHCQFGPYASITGASTDPYVDQNVWNPISGWQQTLHATDPGALVRDREYAGRQHGGGVVPQHRVLLQQGPVRVLLDRLVVHRQHPHEGRDQRRGLVRHLVQQHGRGRRGDDPERLLARAGPQLRDLDSDERPVRRQQRSPGAPVGPVRRADPRRTGRPPTATCRPAPSTCWPC